ncbi:PucR family transcriptional regulator [Amycolatopsis magusensis]|uniref:PucR C-terminal helix-turn-helix domain-containing protein n=2 Tax=Amycolatopsis magusensis TaxID=882444 RepID=A0ABS4PV52_9PSEU|nr:PucR family transcriptional regulator [Amycolatopsis magusensis]MBP2182724.1 hypothetical protein [Amycolatopsis magusensis]
MSVLLSQVLSLGLFTRHTFVGTEAALRTVVDSVVTGVSPHELAQAAPAALVVFPRNALRGEEAGTEQAIRAGARRSIAGLVLPDPPHPLTPAIRALAERNGVPLVLVDHADPDALVPALDHFARRPEAAAGGVLGLLAHRLHAAAGETPRMVRIAATTLGHPVGTVAADGRVLSGTVPAAAVRVAAERFRTPRPAPWVRGTGDRDLLLAHPVRGRPGTRANLWLVALVPSGTPGRVLTAAQALGVLDWAFAAQLATSAVDLERRGRRQEAVLARLLAQADAPHRRVLERATALGWQLEGTHTAVQLTARQAGAQLAPSELTALLGESLAEGGVPAAPISHGGGWALWYTGERVDPDAVATELRRALLAAEREHPGLRLCAGIGPPAEGVAGLRRSLAEARRACLIAAARNTPAAVEGVGHEVKRLLAGSYAPGVQHELARRLLRPLTRTDAGGQLIATLACYLDNESSATPTAAALGVHRNTVLQRLDRIRSLLAVDLADPDERLAVHLAVRLVQIGTPEAV